MFTDYPKADEAEEASRRKGITLHFRYMSRLREQMEHDKDRYATDEEIAAGLERGTRVFDGPLPVPENAERWSFVNDRPEHFANGEWRPNFNDATRARFKAAQAEGIAE